MELLTADFLKSLPSDVSPCYSIYLPTHRKNPENTQDHIRFKNLVKKVTESLSLQYPSRDIKDLVEPLEKLVTDSPFWNKTLDAVVIFGAPQFFKVITLPMSVQELVIVANNFYVKPLRKYLQTVDRYSILGLTQNKVQLFEGNRHSLVEIPLDPDIPKNLAEALGEEVTGRHVTVASYGGTGEQSGAMHHGHGSKKDEVDRDLERFFNIIADKIYEKYSKVSGLPLILAAVPEYHNLFHAISKNEFLLKEGITVNPEPLSAEELTKRAWGIMGSHYKVALKDLVDAYEQAKTNNMGDDSVEKIAQAAAEGRVATVLIEADRIIEGTINTETGSITPQNIQNPDVNDVLNDIANLVEQKGGKIVILTKEEMPSNTGIAALFRY